jgi:hypothetical protein
VSDAPCTAAEAVARLRALLETHTGQYVYGAGDYNPNGLPWTKRARDGLVGGDCRVAFLHAWKIHGTRPGYNRGSWASVADDVNYTSLLEDGDHARDLGITYRAPLALAPRPGDIVAYPTFYLPGHPKPWIGHGALVELAPDDYVPGEGWTRLTLLQCHGPDKFSPGIVRTNGAHFDQHDKDWPKDEHRCALFRPQERT